MYSGLVCITFSFNNIWGKSIGSKEFYEEMAAQGKFLYEDIMMALLLIIGIFLYSIGINTNGENI